ELWGELARLVEWIVHGPPAREPHDGFVDRETGVGTEHLVPGLDERERRAEQDRFGTRRDHDVLRGRLHTAHRQRARDRIAELRYAGCERVARESIAQRAHARLHHVGRRGHIGLADLEMYDLVPGRFESLGGPEDDVGLLGTERLETCSGAHRSTSPAPDRRLRGDPRAPSRLRK